MEKEDEDRECAICKDDMHTLAFSIDSTEVPDTVHRLSCNHAFHSSCLLMFFRSNSKTACPLCRSGSERHIVTRQQGNYTFTVTENEEEEEAQNPWENMENALRKYRSTSPIRFARKDLKVKIKEYNVLKTRLKGEKKKCIQAALLAFRGKCRAEYRKVQDSVKEAALNVHALEKECYVEEWGLTAYEERDWKDIHELMGKAAQLKDDVLEARKHDPWNSSFWYA
jgi:hypothetical protein